MSKVLTARITSKNQLTLRTDLVERLGVRAGDSLRFEIHGDGVVTVARPSFEERIRPWVGFLRGREVRPTGEATALAIREMRGAIDE